MTNAAQLVRKAAANGAQIAVFAELSFMPFFPQYRLEGDRFAQAETIPGPLTDRFSELARELGMVIIPNIFERDGDHTFDASPVIDADGTLLGVARMMHITQYEGFWEQDYYTPGKTGAPVFETRFGRIGVAICYDRHYPEYMRILGLEQADLVVVPQAGTSGEWPDGVVEAEIQAASLQNGYFTALCNRVGQEGNLTFSGGSFVTDPWGRIIALAPEGKDAVLYAHLDLSLTGTSPARQLFMRHRRPGEYRFISNDRSRFDTKD